MNVLNKVLNGISDAINGSERALLDLISLFVPWAVPIIPAYLTYFHTLNEMDFPRWVAWTSAFVVEALGITSVSTAIRFWKNNTMYKSQQEKAPFWLAVAVYVFYIVVTLTVNVILEITTGKRSETVILAIGLFTLLSVPSGVLISIRAQYRETLEERNIRKQERHRPMSVTYAKNTDFDMPGLHREKLIKTCPGCGKTFSTTFPKKTTCSDRCRKRMSRNKGVSAP